MRTSVARLFKKHTYSLALAADAVSQVTAITPYLGISGGVLKLVVTIPDWTNTVTTVITMNNADSKEIFQSASMDQNDEYDITLAQNECIIMGQSGEEWKVTLSGVPGGTGGTVSITVYVKN